jgi:hypothetical protein
MRTFILAFLSVIPLNLWASPCQVKLVLEASGKSVINISELDNDGKIAREILTDNIEALIEGTREAGLELIEEDNKQILRLNLISHRKYNKLRSTSIEVEFNYENKWGARSSVKFSRESSLPFLAQIGITSASLAQRSELKKRVFEALAEVKSFPGCR